MYSQFHILNYPILNQQQLPRTMLRTLLRDDLWQQSFKLIAKLFSTNKMRPVGFKKEGIQDIKKLTYQSPQPLQYVDGKLLVYRCRRPYYRKLLSCLHINSLLVYNAYLIYTNFYRAVSRVPIPVLGLFEVAGLIWLGRKCSQNQNIVSEIYLLEGGFATEVVYNNELKRKLFQEQQTIVLSNSVFGITDEWNPLASRTFPTTKKELQNKKLLEECWRKNYSNNDTYLLIPKSYEFMRENLMIEIMKGKMIKER